MNTTSLNKKSKQTGTAQAETLVIPPPNSFLNMDCMELMKLLPDDFIDLAIVDPPYGVGIDEWDIKPTEAYWGELFRISKNQIVWGGNYFNLPIKRGWIIWDKTERQHKWRKDRDCDDAELAWTSYDRKTTIIKFTDFGNTYGWNGNLIVDYNFKGKIHPTQKHVEIYRYLLKEFASVGDLILDTHVGSGSSLVACKELGYDYWGTEIDKEYYEGAKARIEKAFRQYELL